jgi:16S rRNA (uracil1498-N3)-methyltransferase
MVEKLTELGVTRLIPLETGHSVVEPGTKKLDKLRQTVVAAAKQSGRSRLMEIDGLTPWDAFVNRGFTGSAVFVADPAGQPISPFLTTLREADESTILLIVGPEGGLTANETEQAREAGAKCIRLGRQILRIETAAIALAALFSIGPQH